MKLSQLLHQRVLLLRQAHLANLAYAHQRLDEFATRIARAGLAGPVLLRHCDPEAERYWPTLTALAGSQAVIEEHFTDEDIAELAQVLEFATDEPGADLTFRLEELGERFMRPVGLELEKAGVQLGGEPRPLEESSRGDPAH